MSNITPHIEALAKELGKLGADSVKSSLAKPRMALTVIRAACGLDDPDGNTFLTAEHAGEIYAKYKAGRSAEIAKGGGITAGMEDNAKSDAANTTKVRQQINFALSNPGSIDGTIPSAYDIAERAIELRKIMAQGGEQVKDTYQAITDIAVQHNKNAGKTFDDDELRAIMSKPGKKDKTDIDRMVEEYKRLHKLAHGTEENPGIDAMMPVFDAIDALFEELGMDRPAMTAEDKKAEKALAFLKSTGRVSVVTQ